MKTLITFLMLFFSLNAFAMGGPTNAPVIPSVTVNGRVFTDVANLKILYCFVTSASRNATCRLQGSSSGYQVTSGKTLTIYASMAATNSTSSGVYYLGYGDTDVGWDSASQPTNQKYVGNQGSTLTNQGFTLTTNGTTSLGAPFPIDFQIPSQKYPFMQCASTLCTVTLYGYEQ